MRDLCTTMCEVTKMNHGLVRVGALVWMVLMMLLFGLAAAASVAGGLGVPF